MSPTNPYLEEVSSQLPALQLLIAMGWQYLAPDEALALRGGREKNVVLTGVRELWLRAYNVIEFKGRRWRDQMDDRLPFAFVFPCATMVSVAQ